MFAGIPRIIGFAGIITIMCNTIPKFRLLCDTLFHDLLLALAALTLNVSNRTSVMVVTMAKSPSSVGSSASSMSDRDTLT